MFLDLFFGGARMDAKRTDLEKKLTDSMRQTAAIAAELQALDQGNLTPHFDQIELPAHDIGQQLSQMIQSTRGREIAATNLDNAACPDCGLSCPVETFNRIVQSIDGPIELTELVACCRRCRRSFFPST